MPETKLRIEPSTMTAETPSFKEVSAKSRLLPVVMNLVVFALAFAASWFHATMEPNSKITFFGDSSLYLKGTQLLCQAVAANGLSALLDARVVEMLTFDGTLLPISFASLCGLLKQDPGFSNWGFFVLMQSILHAASACLVGNLVRLGTRNNAAAIFSALLWGLYPPALVAATRYLTESITVTVSLAFANLLALEDRKQRFSKYLAGALLGLLIINKPGLAAGACLGALIFLLSSRRDWWRIALPAVAAVGAWWSYTGISGRHFFSLARKPIGNAVTGWDFEMEAMMNFPGAPILALFNDDDSPIAVVFAQWWNHPFECLHLACVKIQRIWAVPWNDFRHQVLGMTNDAQVVVHQILLYALLCSLAAICWVIASRRSKPIPIVFGISLAFIAGHLVYILFEPIPRYAFTAMPFVVVVSTIGLAVLPSIPGKIKAAAAAIAAVLFIAITHVEDMFPLNASTEAQHKMSAAARYVQKITLPERVYADRSHISDALVLLDASQSCNPVIRVNGHELPGPYLPLFYFNSSTYNYFNIWREISYLLNKSPDALRQWRAVPVPVSLLRTGLENVIEISQPEGEASIFSDSDTNGRKILTWTGFHPSRLYHHPFIEDMRIPSVVPTARAERCSFVVADGAEHELSSRNLRVHLLLAFDRRSPGALSNMDRQSAGSARSSSAATTNGSSTAATSVAEFNSKDFDPVLRDPSYDRVGISGPLLKAIRTNAAAKDLHFLTTRPYAKFVLSGQVKGIKNDSRIGIWAMVKGKNGYGIIPARLPLVLKANDQWQSFCHQDYVALGFLNGSISSVELALYPGPWYEVATYGAGRQAGAAFLRGLKVELTPVDLPDISGKAAVVY